MSHCYALNMVGGYWLFWWIFYSFVKHIATCFKGVVSAITDSQNPKIHPLKAQSNDTLPHRTKIYVCMLRFMMGSFLTVNGLLSEKIFKRSVKIFCFIWSFATIRLQTFRARNGQGPLFFRWKCFSSAMWRSRCEKRRHRISAWSPRQRTFGCVHPRRSIRWLSGRTFYFAAKATAPFSPSWTPSGNSLALRFSI